MNRSRRQLAMESLDRPLDRKEKWQFRVGCLIILLMVGTFFLAPLPVAFLVFWFLLLGDLPKANRDGHGAAGRPLIGYWVRWFRLAFRPQWPSTKHIVPALVVVYLFAVMAGGLLFRFTGRGPYAAHMLLQGVEENWVLYGCALVMLVSKYRRKLLPGVPAQVMERITLMLIFLLLCALFFFQIGGITGDVP